MHVVVAEVAGQLAVSVERIVYLHFGRRAALERNGTPVAIGQQKRHDEIVFTYKRAVELTR